MFLLVCADCRIDGSSCNEDQHSVSPVHRLVSVILNNSAADDRTEDVSDIHADKVGAADDAGAVFPEFLDAVSLDTLGSGRHTDCLEACCKNKHDSRRGRAGEECGQAHCCKSRIEHDIEAFFIQQLPEDGPRKKHAC